MKKVKILFTIAFGIFLMSSCDDALDIIQDGELTIDLNTEADLEQYLKGQVYRNLDVSSEISLTAVFTDEVSIGVDNGGQDISLHRFFLNQSDGYVADIWLTNYVVINGVNRMLDQAVKIPETPKSKSILAEARVLRAYSYLQLLSYFSTDMSNDNALGVMLLDFVPELNTKLPRVSNGEIFQLIESDLQYAKDNFTGSNGATATNAYKYVTKDLINSIYARMYLYRKNYPEAKLYAEKVKNESGLTLTTALIKGPALAQDYSPYKRMWSDHLNNQVVDATFGNTVKQSEIIFAMSRPTEGTWGNIASAFYFNTTNATGGAYLEMGRNLYNKLVSVNGDTRLAAFVDSSKKDDPDYDVNPDYLSSDVLPIDKYPGKGAQPLRNDLKAFRLSEIYFILAECAIFQGDLPTAAAYIKNIRDARNSLAPVALPVYASEAAAIGDLLDERRKELCFEGFRYLDIKRLGTLGNRAIERDATDDQIKSLPLTLPNADYRLRSLPIPQSEVSGNPTIQQNPGYGGN